MASDFLFELGCEELPSKAVKPLAEALANNLLAALDKAQIRYSEMQSFASPRRLAVIIYGVGEEQPNQTQVRRGPALAAAYDNLGKPTAALLGFAKSCGVSPEFLKNYKTDKGEWLIYEVITEGAKTADLLPEFVKQALANLPIAKPMRWGAGEEEFARPVHWAVMLLANKVIDCSMLGVKTGRHTYGHRFLHPQAIEIDEPKQYANLLQKGYVIANFEQRRDAIIKQVEAIAKKQQAKAIMPADLLDEVTSIVEWPQALLATFDKAFLNAPAESLIASMQSHQKCFALESETNQLLPYFITVANLASTSPEQVIAGNEKVMRARLSDAAFFFEQDQKVPLHHHIPATAKVIFQNRLGSLQDKAQRMQKIMQYLALQLNLDPQQAMRAAELSKCDLITGMVGEFPELQGLMGYYYARHDGENEQVALALKEQYMPRFAGDDLPSSSLGLALSLADRLDTLAGIFAIGEKPSGVKDPFKLRRHALAIVRMLINIAKPLKLDSLIKQALDAYSNLFSLSQSQLVMDELRPFILERMQSYYQSYGYNIDLVHAVRVREDQWLYDFDKRIHALASFITLPEAAILSAACKRVNNLLQQASQTNNSDEINENLLQEGAEKALFAHLQAIEKIVLPLYQQEDYLHILNQLANLREPVDAFFEHVMVMVENQTIRSNRLRLLARLQNLLQGVADISLLQLNL